MATIGKYSVAKSIIIKLLILIMLLAMGIFFNAPSMHDLNPFSKKKVKATTEYSVLNR